MRREGASLQHAGQYAGSRSGADRGTHGHVLANETRRRTRRPPALALVLVAVVCACGRPEGEAPQSSPGTEPVPPVNAEGVDVAPAAAAREAALLEAEAETRAEDEARARAEDEARAAAEARGASGRRRGHIQHRERLPEGFVCEGVPIPDALRRCERDADCASYRGADPCDDLGARADARDAIEALRARCGIEEPEPGDDCLGNAFIGPACDGGTRVIRDGL